MNSQVLDLDGLAIIDLLSGEPVSATAALTRALDSAPEVNSARVDRNLRRTLQLGQSLYPDVSDVHEVADRARTILPGTPERV